MNKKRVSVLTFLFFLWLIASPCLAIDSITFSWLPNPESDHVIGYRIYYGTSSQNYTLIHQAGLPAVNNGRCYSTVDVTELTVGATYYFAATAYNTAAESDYSAEVSVVITPGTGNIKIHTMRNI